VEALGEPQLTALDMVVNLPHPALGQVQTLGNPIKLSRTPAHIDRPPPALGNTPKKSSSRSIWGSRDKGRAPGVLTSSRDRCSSSVGYHGHNRQVAVPIRGSRTMTLHF